MKIIIYDTEFTAWQGSAQRGWQGPNEHKELIQVSALKLEITTSDIRVVDEMHHFIKPTINYQLSDYIKNLTLITQEQVDKGLSANNFYDALKTFTEQGIYPIFSWGNDFHVLQETAQLNQISTDWINSYDLAPIFHDYGVPKSTTSGTLYQFFGLSLKLHEHNAKDDTLSLFHSLRHLHSQHAEKVINTLNSCL